MTKLYLAYSRKSHAELRRHRNENAPMILSFKSDSNSAIHGAVRFIQRPAATATATAASVSAKFCYTAL